jgi:hypothetical protein
MGGLLATGRLGVQRALDRGVPEADVLTVLRWLASDDEKVRFLEDKGLRRTETPWRPSTIDSNLELARRYRRPGQYVPQDAALTPGDDYTPF